MVFLAFQLQKWLYAAVRCGVDLQVLEWVLTEQFYTVSFQVDQANS